MTLPTAAILRRLAKHGLHSTGYYRRRLSRVEFPGVAVLCYHGIRADEADEMPFQDLHVSRTAFEGHCRLLSEYCSPITTTTLLAAFDGAPLPPRPVLVTFDDGYRSVVDYGLPILERYGIPAVVFACVAPIERREHFWFDSLCRQKGEAAVLAARGASAAEWRVLASAAVSRADATDVHRPMTVEELLRLASSPLIEIGGHTLTHPTLAAASGDQQREEIDGCRDELFALIGRQPTSFAYPYGLRPKDYSTETMALVAGSGFTHAFSTLQQFARHGSDRFEIPRFVMLDGIDEAELAHRLAHSWHVAPTL